ncbi:ABC transporter permease [Alteribacter natronophilus]|uniref:ABC transporter permease n=1 Tax=Alteribacter natronophilus TaxID=2583810 RepID=UPI00110F4F4B|nr:ABC transporter permease [Alteribacter natronophilus]TMW71094.1 ABC transporter permease [Alteribacter natronophilus]
MFALLHNEWSKLWNKKQPWIFIGILIVISIGTAFLYTAFDTLEGAGTEGDGENWEVTLELENEQYAQTIAESDDEWEREFAQDRIEENEALLAAGVDPNETNNAVFLNEMIYVGTAFITLFAVILASTIVSSEQDKGTLKHLFVRPYERWQFLVAKFITVILFAAVMLVTVTAVQYLMGTIMFGTGSFSTPVVEYGMGGVITTTVAEVFPQKIGLYFLNMLMFVVISFSISILFKSQTLAVGIGIFILFGTNILQGFAPLLQDYFWYPYVFLPHMTLQSYVVTDEFIPGVGLGFSLAVLAVYAVLFLGAATAFFQKRDLV